MIDPLEEEFYREILAVVKGHAASDHLSLKYFYEKFLDLGLPYVPKKVFELISGALQFKRIKKSFINRPDFWTKYLRELSTEEANQAVALRNMLTIYDALVNDEERLKEFNKSLKNSLGECDEC